MIYQMDTFTKTTYLDITPEGFRRSYSGNSRG